MLKEEVIKFASFCITKQYLFDFLNQCRLCSELQLAAQILDVS